MCRQGTVRIICVGLEAKSTDTVQLASGSGAVGGGGVCWACKTRLNANHRKLGIVGVGGAIHAYILRRVAAELARRARDTDPTGLTCEAEVARAGRRIA